MENFIFWVNPKNEGYSKNSYCKKKTTTKNNLFSINTGELKKLKSLCIYIFKPLQWKICQKLLCINSMVIAYIVASSEDKIGSTILDKGLETNSQN